MNNVNNGLGEIAIGILALGELGYNRKNVDNLENIKEKSLRV